jgi:cytochrome c oxidase cbb3-type subunit IV
MATYEAWREFAATWGFGFFALIFVAAVAYAFLPSRRKTLEEAAQIPLKED